MDLFADALALFTPLTIALLVGGLAIGFAAGAIPGLSAATVVALFLPLSITVDPSTALIFMAAVYCGAQYGAAPPAVLLNMPGDAGAMVTALDGYPMTQRGEGMRALGIGRVASGLAGVIAGVIVIAVFQPLSGILLSFGAPETFALAIVGVTVIATVSESNLVRGLLCAAAGVLLSLMSADPIYGSERLSFGIPELYDSFPFVPALIGLFGASELARILRRPRVERGEIVRPPWMHQLRQLTDGFKDTLTRPIALVRGTLIGLLIGILPGTGGAVSNFISYSVAKRLSRRPETFGTGNPEGIIASETADNGVTAGAMVPTFAFGIPGSATSAVMLSALLLHGVTPGPRVFASDGALVYGVLIAIVVASILTIPLGTLLGTAILKLTQTPIHYLVPAVVIIATMGTYSFRRSLFDVVLLVIFAVVGYFMRVHGLPITALVMGIILGPIMEGNFIRSLLISSGDPAIFVRGPVTWILWLVVLAMIVAGPIIGAMRRRRAATVEARL